MEIFSNREIAMGIWTFAVAVFSVAKAATADASTGHIRSWAADNLRVLVLVEFYPVTVHFSHSLRTHPDPRNHCDCPDGGSGKRHAALP